MADVYVHRTRFFDTPAVLAQRLWLSEAELRAANPNWQERVLIFFREGEEIIVPINPALAVHSLLLDSGEVYKKRPPHWFPEKPSFGSPSKPLSTLLAKLGNPKYTVDKPGTYHSPITFTDGWATRNVSRVSIPQLEGVPFGFALNKSPNGSMMFYTNAHRAVQTLFKAWEDAGLLSFILTFEGSFFPRVIKSTNTPSNHSFGTGFDINGFWNAEGTAPAGIGKKGCLLELVPIANKNDFYWGGFYKDGMHFEYAGL
jgi:hypothetical protein